MITYSPPRMKTVYVLEHDLVPRYPVELLYLFRPTPPPKIHKTASLSGWVLMRISLAAFAILVSGVIRRLMPKRGIVIGRCAIVTVCACGPPSFIAASSSCKALFELVP